MSAHGLIREELARGDTGRASAVTIGKFDGVHRGHQFLMGRLRRAAEERGYASVVVTFHPHPATVLRPGTKVAYLTSLEERIALLRAGGVDSVVPLTFTSELAQLAAADFVGLLRDELNMRLLVVGPDFALGRGREGTVDFLRALGPERGFEVEVIDQLEDDGAPVRSSAVRAALAEGDMRELARLLGRPFSLEGPVVRGAQRGRGIGYATANLALGADRALPAFGVYAVRVWLGEARYDGATNIGVRPTFDNGAPSIETHILDFDGRDLYGVEMRIELVERIRGEAKFASVDELIAQIGRDAARARAILAKEPE